MTGVAWLSSARVVRCMVKSSNERNPYPYLPALRVGTIRRPPCITRRKAGTTSSHHGPYGLGYTRATMGDTDGCESASWSQSHKVFLSPDWESATRLHEAGIASNRGSERHGEYVPGSCTHRPSRHGSVLHQKWFA